MRCLGAAGAAGAGVFVGACGAEQASEREGGGDQAAGSTGPCSDLSGLTSKEIQKRKALGYVSDSPRPSQVCANCQLWIAPEQEGQPCGGCILIQGPIHPKGYCNSWAPQT